MTCSIPHPTASVNAEPVTGPDDFVKIAERYLTIEQMRLLGDVPMCQPTGDPIVDTLIEIGFNYLHDEEQRQRVDGHLPDRPSHRCRTGILGKA